MTRWGILMTYKIVGPILLIFLILEELAALGIIDLSERTPLGNALYTPRVMITMALGLSIPIVVILAGVIAYRFGTDWPVTLPVILLGLAFALLLAEAFLDPPEKIKDLSTNVGLTSLVGAVLAAIWAGWFAKTEPLG